MCVWTNANFNLCSNIKHFHVCYICLDIYMLLPSNVNGKLLKKCFLFSTKSQYRNNIFKFIFSICDVTRHHVNLQARKLMKSLRNLTIQIEWMLISIGWRCKTEEDSVHISLFVITWNLRLNSWPDKLFWSKSFQNDNHIPLVKE